METRDKPSYQFGAFQLNSAGRELLRGDERLELPPRVFDTLVLLVEEKGKLVEKDRLMSAVWPDTVVEENNLSQAIYLLRKTLHDGDNGIRYIETVPKRGYRFVARVQRVENEVEPSLSGSPSPVQLEPATGNSGNNGSSQVTVQALPKSRWLVWCIAGLAGASPRCWWCKPPDGVRGMNQILNPSGLSPCCRCRTYPMIPSRSILRTE